MSDDAAMYASTLYPVVYWHAHLSSSRFAWFVQGDFVNVSGYAAAILPIVKVIWVVALAAFATVGPLGLPLPIAFVILAPFSLGLAWWMRR